MYRIVRCTPPKTKRLLIVGGGRQELHLAEHYSLPQSVSYHLTTCAVAITSPRASRHGNISRASGSTVSGRDVRVGNIRICGRNPGAKGLASSATATQLANAVPVCLHLLQDPGCCRRSSDCRVLHPHRQRSVVRRTHSRAIYRAYHFAHVADVHRAS